MEKILLMYVCSYKHDCKTEITITDEHLQRPVCTYVQTLWFYYCLKRSSISSSKVDSDAFIPHLRMFTINATKALDRRFKYGYIVSSQKFMNQFMTYNR